MIDAAEDLRLASVVLVLVQQGVEMLLDLHLEEHADSRAHNEDRHEDPEHVVHLEQVGIFAERGWGDDLRFVRVVAWEEECPGAHEPIRTND